MGWQDRPYYRDNPGSSGSALAWLWTGSVPLFTAFRVRVRMHASLLVLFAVLLLVSLLHLKGEMGPQDAITFCVLLFVIIVLHEFGHCFAARSVGGDAENILLSPLGGLAFANAPRRPWPQTVTVVGGPLVNVAICIVAAAALALVNWHHPDIPLNPLSNDFRVPYGSLVGYYVWWLFILSWALLLFNLLPIYPLDGGQLLRALLWFKLGFYRSSLITTVVGMIGSALMVLFGLMRLGSWSGALLIVIGANCFINCYQLRAQLKAAGPWEFEDQGADYSASMWHPDTHPKKRKRLSSRAKRKLRKQAEQEENEQVMIDVILAKVSAKGMHSLTWMERRALRRATERQRRQEIEVSGNRD